MKTCPLCKREIPIDQESKHHLVPNRNKLKRKKHLNLPEKEIEILHIACHRKLHSLFTNKELSIKYNTIEKLLEHQDIQNFVFFIRKKPIDYIESSKQSNKRKRSSHYS